MDGGDHHQFFVNWVRLVLVKTGATTQTIRVRFEEGAYINVNDDLTYVIERPLHNHYTDVVFYVEARATCLRDETEWILVNGVPTTVQCSSFLGSGTGGD